MYNIITLIFETNKSFFTILYFYIIETIKNLFLKVYNIITQIIETNKSFLIILYFFFIIETEDFTFFTYYWSYKFIYF